MADTRIEDWAKQDEPTQAGWYQSNDARLVPWMIFSLNEDGQWYAHALNGETTACEWGYIEQAGAVSLLAAYR